MKIRLVLMAAVATLLAAWCASPTMADSIQLQCGTCTSGSVTQMSNAGTVSFSFVDVANQTIVGNAFIAILVPTGGTAPTLTGGTLLQTVSFTSGDLGTLLGQSLNSYNFSSFQSASAQAAINASGYTVYEYSVGTGVTLGPQSAGINGLSFTAPTGSVIVGALADFISVYLDLPSRSSACTKLVTSGAYSAVARMYAAWAHSVIIHRLNRDRDAY